MMAALPPATPHLSRQGGFGVVRQVDREGGSLPNESGRRRGRRKASRWRHYEWGAIGVRNASSQAVSAPPVARSRSPCLMCRRQRSLRTDRAKSCIGPHRSVCGAGRSTRWAQCHGAGVNGLVALAPPDLMEHDNQTTKAGVLPLSEMSWPRGDATGRRILHRTFWEPSAAPEAIGNPARVGEAAHRLAPLLQRRADERSQSRN